MAKSLVDRLTELGDDKSALVRREMGNRRERWLPGFQAAIADDSDVALSAARCLEELSSPEDVSRLRQFSKRRSADPDLGRGLARRVAEPVFVEDQGRVVISDRFPSDRRDINQTKSPDPALLPADSASLLINPRRSPRCALAGF